MSIATQSIDIKNIGPVEHVSIPVPENGGVIVLRGRNGIGKTSSINAVESAVSGRGKLDVRDGALAGEVSGLGVTLKVGRSTRRTGELEVSTLEGRLSVADLVDPGLKTPDAADAKRIKSLIQLTQAEASPSLFYDLFGGRGEMEAVVSASTLEVDDLVALADKIKRDAESKARAEESAADIEDGRVKALKESASGVDLDTASDPNELQARLEDAISLKSRLTAAVDAHRKATDSAELAKFRLSKADGEYVGKSLEACIEAEEMHENGVAVANESVRKAEEALTKARADAEQARNKLGSAITERKNAERHTSMVAEWKSQIEGSIPLCPTDDEVANAAAAVLAAREAVEDGVKVRKAISDRTAAIEHAKKVLKHRKRAARLREAAKGTDEVLSAVVAQLGTDLRVTAGRLALKTKRGDTYFADLSHGERWKIALDIAIRAVGAGGVIVIPQEAWEGLDPIARQTIVDHVKGSEVVILTAECSSDEAIIAEVMQ